MIMTSDVDIIFRILVISSSSVLMCLSTRRMCSVLSFFSCALNAFKRLKHGASLLLFKKSGNARCPCSSAAAARAETKCVCERNLDRKEGRNRIRWRVEQEPSGATWARVAPSSWPWLPLLPKLLGPLPKESLFPSASLRLRLKKEKGTTETRQSVVSVRNFFRETLFTSVSSSPLFHITSLRSCLPGLRVLSLVNVKPLYHEERRARDRKKSHLNQGNVKKTMETDPAPSRSRIS